MALRRGGRARRPRSQGSSNVTIRSQTDTELVIETPHKRVGGLERPLVTFRQGLDHIVLEDRRGKGGESTQLLLERIDCVRLIPAATPGFHLWQRGRDRWSVALRFKNGEDLILEQHLEADSALKLAQRVCSVSGAQLDETSRRMFLVPDSKAEQ
jgi:hypothetical protein